MAEILVEGGVSADAGLLADLSCDLLKVAERIQAELEGVAFHAITPSVLTQVEAAEAAVDVLAQDLSRGEGELAEWHRVLTDYEAAWHRVIVSLKKNHN